MSDGQRFLHIGFHNFSETNEIIKALEKVFNGASDWARYAPNCWILWTNNTPEVWFKRIEVVPELPKNFGVLIAPIDLNREQRSGSTYDWMWKWIQKYT